MEIIFGDTIYYKYRMNQINEFQVFVCNKIVSFLISGKFFFYDCIVKMYEID